ncbi:MAG: phosphatidate cytidylyltransferase [bacterium]|nr:phosphatidate cytidylyltransferase [bacterium]
MLKRRIMTALVGLPLFLVLIFYAPPFLFFLAVLVVALIGQSECYNMFEHEELQAQRFLGLLLGALLLWAFHVGQAAVIQGSVLCAVVAILASRVFFPPSVSPAVGEAAVTLLGLFYAAFLFGYIILIRGEPHGSGWVLFLFLVVWGGDTGAFFTGKTFGKRKLMERISPKKTWEGAAGGLACSGLLAALAWVLFLSPRYTFLQILLLGIILGGVGQIGDLVESLLKRSAGVKDSGTLLPGHGGVLDRFDGILLSAPVLYYLVL